MTGVRPTWGGWDMNRGNIVSQMEVAAPGLLLYEEEVRRDEAPQATPTASRPNQNLPGVDITTGGGPNV